MITPEDNIILTGFSGIGKTTVGRLLAARLRRRFVDMDEEIARRLELTIPGVFARFGEGRFRDEERLLVQELVPQRGLVIAAGGGTIVDKRNLELLASSGAVIALRARPETIARRLAGIEPRPLLEGPDPLARIRELKAARKHVYDAVPLQIKTDDLLPAEVVDRILDLAQVNTEE
jgi:shikimate kinase